MDPLLSDSASQPAWIDARGRKDGRYIVGPLLGHGSMGDVYEAWDIVLARPVALKILKHLEPAAMIRFMHEAQLHARLDSPNICRIYDVDATGGTPRIAMQLVRGPTLEDAADDLRLDEILGILAQVADAVHAAHQLNLIHRDIKPSNVLLQWKDTCGWVPYICDFGLAMALDRPALTQPLALTGTPAYMAPEQVRGDRSLVGPATDVYGIGGTLYFAVVGRPPCVSTTTAEMLRVKRERRFPRPRALEPGLPPGLEAILLKCLEPNPADRYQSAAELAEELRRIRDLATGQPRAELGFLGRVRALARRRRAPMVALGALAALVGALPAGIGYFRRDHVRQGMAAQYLAFAAAGLEQGIRNERALPVHDLRPAAAQTLERIGHLRLEVAAMGSAAPAMLHFAAGRARFLLNDLPAARTALDQAWAEGLRTPDTAFLLAQVYYRISQAQGREAAFLGQEAATAVATAAQANGFLRQARPQTSHPRAYAAALAASLKGAYPEAAAEAGESLKGNPWHLESAILGAQSLAVLAKERLDAGDSEQAEARYREALELAGSALPRGPSDQRLRLAAVQAELGLAALAEERGELTGATLAELDRDTGLALDLDPGNPEAQSAWLRARIQRAMHLWQLGQDPRMVLDHALEFYWTGTAEPRGPDLRMDHLVLYWLQAERDFARGEDPGPSLAEALRDPGHTVTWPRDYLGDLLNFKARYEASLGQDPRPTVETTLARFEPPARPRSDYAACEIAAKAWLIRSEWEAGHGIDPADSLRRAQALLRDALEGKPASASARALLDLSHLLQAKGRTRQRQRALFLARQGSETVHQPGPADRETARLQGLLAVP